MIWEWILIAAKISIHLMNRFSMSINGRDVSWLAEKSPLGLGVMVYLIVQRNKPVPTGTLEKLFWGEGTENSMGALRTLISRFRALLNEIDPSVGACIVYERGFYQWKSAPGQKWIITEFWT